MSVGSLVVSVGSIVVGVGSVVQCCEQARHDAGEGSVVQCSEQTWLYVGVSSVVRCSEQARHDVGVGSVVVSAGSAVQCSEQTGLYGGLGPVSESAVSNQLRAGSIHVGSAVEYSDRGEEGAPCTNGFCLLQRMLSNRRAVLL